MSFCIDFLSYILYLAFYEIKKLDNNTIVIYKKIFSHYNQYYKTKTKLIYNKQLKTCIKLLVTIVII